MNGMMTIFKRELKSYFSTPLAYLFIAVFLCLSGIFTFDLANFYEARQASLQAFFNWHPWLYLFLVPAVSMRIWAEERRSGTIELLLTLPVTQWQAVIGKYLAAWVLVGVALLLTFPMLITVFYLGSPDMGEIITGYLGSLLMAGAYLAIGGCISAISKSQVISFVITAVVCFFFILAGLPQVLNWFVDWAPGWLVESVRGISFLTHYQSMGKGVIEMTDVVFFLSLILGGLYACTLTLEAKKAS